MFRIDLLPAEFGDAIWIEYGAGRPVHRILIDCGTKAVFPRLRDRILALSESERHFELFVVTHVDVDHIGGALELLATREQLGVSFGEIWFNGFVHLTPGGVVPRQNDDDILGPLQGEALTEMILAGGAEKWNAKVGGSALVVPDSGPLQALPPLPGGMRLTLLSPMQKHLDQMKPVWDAACRKAGIVPGAATALDTVRLGEEDQEPEEEEKEEEEDDLLGEPDVRQLAATPFKPDRARPNGTSIALLADYDGHRVLLGADAYASVLVDAIARLPGKGAEPLVLDALKMSHHGSRSNTSLELVKAVKCANWLVSTNGKQFKHPNGEAVARAILGSGRGVRLHFNYRTGFNEMWARKAWQTEHSYQALYPVSDTDGVSLQF